MNYLKRNLKLAYKSVVFHFKEYLCFYVALFIIQFLFGMIAMSTVNTNHMREQSIVEEYDYHVCIAGLNPAQYDYLSKRQYAGDGRDHTMLTLLKTESRYEGDNLRYDMYYVYENQYGDSPEYIHSWFSDKALSHIRKNTFNNKNFDVELSPLYHLGEIKSEQNLACLILLGILFAVGVLVLLLLYNIRSNHYKFTYGIYMSYGADFKKLFETSFWEMFVIQLLTLIPAAILSTVVNWLSYIMSGFTYYFSPYMMLIALPFTSVAVFLAVYIPIKRTSIKPPLELLLAEDNSNLVISPRLSFNMYGRRFPSSYSFFSAVRFRKYNLQVVCSAVIFSAMFICAVFGSTIYAHTTESNLPEFSVNFNQHKETVTEIVIVEKDVTSEYKNASADKKDEYHVGIGTKYIIKKADGTPGDMSDISKGGKIYELVEKEEKKTVWVGDTYTAEKGQELLQLSGVTNVYKECYIDANATGTFVYLENLNRVLNDEGMLLYNGYAYTQDASYYATDKEIVDYLVSNYKVSGDPYKLVNNTDDMVHYVIVTNSRNNEDTLALKPGDAIILETFGEVNIKTDEPLTGNRLLQYILENGMMDLDKSYRFEVCAVVENISTSNNYPLFVSCEDYQRVTGKDAQFKSVSVYVDQNLSEKRLQQLTDDLRAWAKQYEDTSVSQLRALEEKSAQRAECRFQLLVAVSVTVLMLAPLFWFFSQTIFYKKREKEIELLRAMGAIESEIRGMFVRDGLVYAAMGAIFTAIFGGIGITVIYRMALKIFAVTSNTFTVRFVLQFPWLVFGCGMLVTVICAFMSSYIPYLRDKKQTEKRMNVTKID